MDETPKVVVVSAIRVVREALAQALSWDGRLRVAVSVPPGPEVLTEVRRQRPAALLMDRSTVGGLEITARVLAAVPELKVVVLGLAETEADIIPWAEAGVAGYVARDGSVDDVVHSVRSAIRDELACSRRVAAVLMKRLANLAERPDPPPAELHLTPRQDEVVSLLDRGLTNQQIAGELSISLSTVKNHVHNILQRLEVGSRGAAVARLRRLGLLRGSPARAGARDGARWRPEPLPAPKDRRREAAGSESR